MNCNCNRSNPWTDFNHLWLKWRAITQGCAFLGSGWRPIILRGSNPQKGGVVRHFPAKRENYKIVMSPAWNIGSISNFDRVIEPLSGWSRITKFIFKMADGAILQNVENAITRLSVDRFGWNLGGRILSCPRHVPHDAVAMATAVA